MAVGRIDNSSTGEHHPIGGHHTSCVDDHRNAITQIRIHPDAETLVKRRLETGSTKQEALRLLKRKLANVVYRTLLTDTQTTAIRQAA